MSMKHARLLLLPVMAAALLIAGCAGFEFDSGKKIAQLREGMAYAEVVALLGQPEMTQLQQGRFTARWSLHVMWKGNVPHDLEFNAKTRRLVAWSANEEEYQKSQQRLAATFGVSTDAPGTENPAASGGAHWAKELQGRELMQSGNTNSSGQYSKRMMILCRNGTYRTSSNSGNHGGGLFLDSRGGSAGRWQASGPANAGTLVLRANNGSQQRYRVNISDEGFYLDGTKWWRGENAGC